MHLKIIILCLFVFSFGESIGKHVRLRDISKLVDDWTKKLEHYLWKYSEAFTRRITLQTSLKETTVVQESGQNVHRIIRDKLLKFMENKIRAVERIRNHADFLSMNRKVPIEPDSSYSYFNSDYFNITDYGMNDFEQDIQEMENFWKCEHQKVLHHIEPNIRHNSHHNGKCKDIPYVERRQGYYNSMPMMYSSHFKTKVNVNISAIKVSPNVYWKEKDLLNDVRWSESLDLAFKKNYRDDPTLTWQYFASPKGFLRIFPARKWPIEHFEKKFDFRIRSWFTEAMSSPKDVVILLDRSGSMKGTGRARSKQIINVILDTLTDNDFVNIFLFNNVTEPLVECFGDNLVQAHEENLRLFRESLTSYETQYPAILGLGVERAFKLLERYRKMKEGGTQCNQVIMIITDGVDNDYGPKLFQQYNIIKKYDRHVRVFTYQIGTEPDDEKILEWIACANLGYYVKIVTTAEVHENVLKYLSVMSRPVNYESDKELNPVWSTLYANLQDRRLTNWLWTKYLGQKQKEIFLKKDIEDIKIEKNKSKVGDIQNDKLMKTKGHMIPRAHKIHHKEYNYMITISLPVYDRRPNQPNVLGVAAVDVPRDLIKSMIPHYLLGVNAYAFIISNNGYLILHPDHRSEFDGILKPTFNRVDMLEVEILDEEKGPRIFERGIVQLRKNIISQKWGQDHFNVRTHIDEMKRVIASRRKYFYGPLGPFSLVIALPEKYGAWNYTHFGEDDLYRQISNIHNRSRSWTLHPEWHYCKKYDSRLHFHSPEEELLYFLKDFRRPYHDFPEEYCDKRLVKAVLADYKITEWFDLSLLQNRHIKRYHHQFPVINTFLATQSGLTRWQDIQHLISPNNKNHFSKKHNRAIDEVWYRRAADMNFDEDVFVFSVPFNSHENVSNTIVTASSVVYLSTNVGKAPAAAVGYQFYQKSLASLFYNITTCQDGKCEGCNGQLSCFILDNNAYIIVDNEGKRIGDFFGNIRPDILNLMVKDGIYTRVEFFDYQAICFVDPIIESFGLRNITWLKHLFDILKWILATMFYFFDLIGAVVSARKEVVMQTYEYENLEIIRTIPTPCDQKRYLYMFPDPDKRNTRPIPDFDEGSNDWFYISKQIPRTNLLFVAINALLPVNMTAEKYTPEPEDIIYEDSLQCYIATHNNYSRRSYLPCITRHPMEEGLNTNLEHCGSKGRVSYYSYVNFDFS